MTSESSNPALWEKYHWSICLWAWKLIFLFNFFFVVSVVHVGAHCFNFENLCNSWQTEGKINAKLSQSNEMVNPIRHENAVSYERILGNLLRNVENSFLDNFVVHSFPFISFSFSFPFLSLSSPLPFHFLFFFFPFPLLSSPFHSFSFSFFIPFLSFYIPLVSFAFFSFPFHFFFLFFFLFFSSFHPTVFLFSHF